MLFVAPSAQVPKKTSKGKKKKENEKNDEK